MSNILPESITIETVNEVKEIILTDVKKNKSIEFDFKNVKEIDVTGIQLIISSLLLCDREKKEVACSNYSDTIIGSIKKNGFNTDKTLLRYLKGE